MGVRSLPDIKDQYKGCWPSIHTHIGIDSRYLKGAHTDCPLCQAGKDRFRYANQSGSGNYYCNQCGHGSGVDLVMRYLDIDYKEAVHTIRTIQGDIKMEEVKSSDDTQKNADRLKRIHAGLKQITPDTAAAKYFASRGITVLPDKNCYFHPSLDYWVDGKSIGKFPCIVSMFRNAENVTSTYHLTYLDQDGKKFAVEVDGETLPAKKMLPTVIPLTGTAIKLFDATDTVCIAEGLETSLAIFQDCGLPVWMAGNTNQIAKMIIPDEIKHVYIYEDADPSFAGRLATSTLANRLALKGDRTTIKIMSLVDTQQITVSQQHFDFNDYIILNAEH